MQTFLLVTGFFFVLLSAGGLVKMVAYKYLPLIGFVRLNGEFRIFAILCFIIIAAIELDKFIRQKNSFSGGIRIIYYLVELLLFIAISIGIYNAVHLEESVLYKWPVVLAENSRALRLKSFIDALSFYDLLWMQGTIQLFLLWGIKWCLRTGNFNALRNIVIADLVILDQDNIHLLLRDLSFFQRQG